jgi:hypothetical protein
VAVGIVESSIEEDPMEGAKDKLMEGALDIESSIEDPMEGAKDEVMEGAIDGIPA